MRSASDSLLLRPKHRASHQKADQEVLKHTWAAGQSVAPRCLAQVKRGRCAAASFLRLWLLEGDSVKTVGFPRGLPSNKTSCAGPMPLTDGLRPLWRGRRRMFRKRPVFIFCSRRCLFVPGLAEPPALGSLRGGISPRARASRRA